MKPFSPFRLFLFLVLFLLPIYAGQAQIVEDLVGANLFLEASTQYPKPNSYVELKLNDYTYGKTISSIDWFINGTEMPEVANQRTVLVLMGDVGQAQEIVAKISAGDTTDSTKIVLRPLYTDIIIESETRSPSFYKGRSLPSSGSGVTATLIIDGLKESPGDLLYNWSIDDTPYSNGVVRGKNKIGFYVPDYSNNFLLAVSVSDLNGVVIAKRVIQVPIVEPEMVFYETTSLYGTRPISISSLIFSGETATIQAEPYNLAVNTFNRPDHLVWEINNEEIQNPATNPYEITLQRSGVSGSSSVIDFHVRDLVKLLQGASGSFDIKL
jgi:hypothetical protein